MKVLPVRRQAVVDVGFHDRLCRFRAPAPATGPVLLHSVAEELSGLTDPDRDRQLVVIQPRQELQKDAGKENPIRV